jgi:hypothetical protein
LEEVVEVLLVVLPEVGASVLVALGVSALVSRVPTRKMR